MGLGKKGFLPSFHFHETKDDVSLSRDLSRWLPGKGEFTERDKLIFLGNYSNYREFYGLCYSLL